MSKKIELDKDKQKILISEIKAYFMKERDEDLGELSASLILDFITEKIAPEFYNLGVQDSYKYIDKKLQDLLEIQK